MMALRVLVSPTAFKGTLSPNQAARLIARGARKRFPGAAISILPLADGGDGTLEVLAGALGGKRMSTIVRGPLGNPVRAHWAIINSKQGRAAVIEMARASGLALVKGKNRIMRTTSDGTGQLILAALDQGCETIYIGVGGSACGEGGAGALAALGLFYRDKNGRALSAKPHELARIASVDWTKFDRRIRHARIIVLCDVTNPLLGPFGSARTFGPQKGATPSQVEALEQLLSRWSRFAPFKVEKRPGAGAAGALAFGLAGFAGAKLKRGTKTVMAALGWENAAKNADFILTGEGRLDQTSFRGKVIGEIARRRGRSKVIAICGSSTLSDVQARRAGLFQVIPLKEFV